MAAAQSTKTVCKSFNIFDISEADGVPFANHAVYHGDEMGVPRAWDPRSIPRVR